VTLHSQHLPAEPTAAQRLLAGLLCVLLLLAGLMAHVPSLHEALHHHDCQPGSHQADGSDPGCDLCVLATCVTTPPPSVAVRPPLPDSEAQVVFQATERDIPVHPELARPRSCGPPAQA